MLGVMLIQVERNESEKKVLTNSTEDLQSKLLDAKLLICDLKENAVSLFLASNISSK